MPDDGPEPTGWELMRGLTEVKQAVKDLGSGFVTVKEYAADTKGNDERHERAEARLADLERNAQDADKLKRQQRLTITIAFAVPIVTFVANYLVNRQ